MKSVQTEKSCSRCKISKSLDAFRARKNYSLGVSCRCIECDRAVTRESYARHREKYREANRVYGRENRAKRTAYGREYTAKNREKLKAQGRERYQADKTRFADARLRYVYGIDLKTYGQMYDAQGGACAICRAVHPVGKLCVDHNHETGAVRGLLCRQCNSAIGFMNDDPAVVSAAASYLTQHEKRS